MHRWKFSALATAAILSAGLYGTDASALALGRVNVQSALGEPLRAEIELPQITAAEAESLRVAPARPEVFRSQGLEYSPAAGNVQIQLHRRADGSMVLRLSSTRPINEPFVDMVIDATWSSGHVVRSYTMLFDPPATERAPATATTAPQLTAPRAETAPAAPRATAPAPAPRAAAPAPAAPAARPAPTVTPAPSRPAVAAASGSGDEVRVRPGDTAGRIANAHRPASVSLDQMLVAMAQANPDAFVQGNVNRLRAGTVLRMPSEADAQATPAVQARQIVAAQSRDFNEYRRRLASVAPRTQVAAAERSASGTVQAQVDESKPAAASPDKLTLSKGGVQARKAEDQMARDKQADQDAARMAELSKNIAELNQIGGGATQAAAAAPGNAASAPGIAVPAPAALPTPVQTTASAEAPAGATDAAGAAASEPAAAAAPKPAPQPAVPEEPSILDSLMEDPLRAGGALALILALLGYGGYRAAQNRRNRAATVDSSFEESRVAPDSFFGSSGGQRVDTASSDLSTGSSSMTYSPSQLDAGGDVDPVAEADVYLAYGRDLQAEEILKEAMRHQPERVAIPAKLAEIYAKRQDRKALESAANDVFRLTNGTGPDWARVSDLGRTLDPENALYRPGGRPATAAGEQPGADSLPPPFPSTLNVAPPSASGPDSVLPALDLDLDLDLDLHEAPAAPAPTPSAFAMAAAANEQAAHESAEAQPPETEAPAPVLDPELPGAAQAPETAADAAEPAPEEEASATGPLPLDFPEDALSLMDSSIAPLTSRDAKAPAVEPLDFDLGDLSLDLTGPGGLTASQPANTPADEPLPDDPLATKLALAEEFNTIGDSEGARTLVEEVIAESSGELKARAQRLLATLS
ncbi:hypothetical protein HF896_16065 [Alicycliphilus denitrificans]|uniref:FimV N-terminal domain-containing protein n=1 Tax=Alicycliphilus denitrificans TaxID=179636 RepID=A0A858ZXY1_9BURK|nr:FimV/HubP family polar landmark protein [Alicycliphilus denitrificans]QKD45029.1 hypothetical protein HF896_16065 [Alicycliphilus denitrificans]